MVYHSFFKYVFSRKMAILILLIVWLCASLACAQKLPDPEGFTLSPSPKWTNGNIRGYMDGECVPFRLELKGPFVAGGTLHEKVFFDQSKDINPLSGVAGVIDLENFILADISTDTNIVNPYTLGVDYNIQLIKSQEPPAGGQNLVEGYYDIDITFLKDIPYNPHTAPPYLYFCSRLSDTAHLWQGCSLHVRRDGANADSQICDPGVIAGIMLTKTATPTSGSPGTEITFTLAVSNTGSVALDPVEVTDTLPLGLTYVSATPVPTTVSPDGKTLTWSNVGPLAAAGSTSIEIKAELDGAAYGSLTNNAEAEGKPPSGDAVTDTDTADVTSNPASIDIEKSANPDIPAHPAQKSHSRLPSRTRARWRWILSRSQIRFQ